MTVWNSPDNFRHQPKTLQKIQSAFREYNMNFLPPNFGGCSVRDLNVVFTWQATQNKANHARFAAYNSASIKFRTHLYW